MKAIKHILFLLFLIVLAETHSQSMVAISGDSKSVTTFTVFMDNAMQKVQQYKFPSSVFYISERAFNGKTQTSATASLETTLTTNEEKLHKRRGTNVDVTVKDYVTNLKSNNSSPQSKNSFSEKSNAKALFSNNPCINRKGVFDVFGKKLQFAGVNIDSENGVSCAHYIWTGRGNNSTDTIRVILNQNTGDIQQCELVSTERGENVEVVLSYFYSFTTKDNALVPTEMRFQSTERNISNTNPFEYTITNYIAMNR